MAGAAGIEAIEREQDGHVVVLSASSGPGVTAARWRAGLLEAFRALEPAGEVRAIVLAGWADRAAGDGAAGVVDALRRRMRACPQPIVAAIDGACVGPGLEVALDCDIRLASDTARFADTSAAPSGSRCAARLAHLLGEAAAKDIVLTGRALGAGEALRLGLVSRVVPAAALMAEARATAATIASRAPLAVAAVKQAAGRTRDLTPAEALAMEHDLFSRLIGTRDREAAVEAFFRKTRPVFRGQ